MSEALQRALADRRRAQRIRSGQGAVDTATGLLAGLLRTASSAQIGAARLALGEETVTALLEHEQLDPAASATG